MTCKFGISGAYRLACRGGKIRGFEGARHTPERRSAPSHCQKHPLESKLYQTYPAQSYGGFDIQIRLQQFITSHGKAPQWLHPCGKELQVQNICTSTARAQCIPAPFFIRRQVGLVKVYLCTEFGVDSSKFP